MPLSKIQTDILRLLALHRDPESYVAGSTPLNRDSRASPATSMFSMTRRSAWREPPRRTARCFWRVATPSNGSGARVADSAYRFFPAMQDETFGYVLHPVDLATNKVAAAYGRREPRDVVDLLTIHERILPLGAVVWAAAGKALGLTPEGIINEIRRIARYTGADFRRIGSLRYADAHGSGRAPVLKRRTRLLEDNACRAFESVFFTVEVRI